MILAKEIRVGNFIMTPGIDRPVAVIPSDIVTIHQLNQRDIDVGYRGVPLTKGILAISQFTYYENKGEWQQEYHLEIGIEGHEETFALIPVTSIVDDVVSEVGFKFVMYHDETSYMRPTSIIKYVHELQNLIYDLYKVTLPINL
jgi:hypothetical protein